MTQRSTVWVRVRRDMTGKLTVWVRVERHNRYDDGVNQGTGVRQVIIRQARGLSMRRGERARGYPCTKETSVDLQELERQGRSELKDLPSVCWRFGRGDLV